MHSETGGTHSSKLTDKLEQAKHMEHITVNIDAVLQVT